MVTYLSFGLRGVKKISMFIYIFFCNNYFSVFQQLVDTHRGFLQIREFIVPLTIGYSLIDHARLMSLKAKIVILLLG